MTENIEIKFCVVVRYLSKYLLHALESATRLAGMVIPVMEFQV